MNKLLSIIKNPYFIIISIALFFYLFRLGSYGFVEWDEPFYSSRALMVVQYGDCIDQSDKALGGLWTGAHPPLVIWMMAASIKIFGVSEFGFRFPIAITGIILVVFFYRLVLFLFNEKIALYSTLILLLNAYVTQYSRMAQLDIPVLMFLLLSFYYLAKGIQQSFYNYIISGVFLGFALLSKIIVGFFIPIIFLFFILYILIIEKKFDKKLAAGFLVQCFVGFLIALPWFVLVTMKLGSAYWEQAVNYHVLGRMGSALENHSSPLGLFYWIHQTFNRINLFFPFLLYGIYIFYKKNVINKELKVLISFWFIIPFLVFTLTATKFHTYILNFILPEILFCGIGVYYALESQVKVSRLSQFIVLSTAAFVWAMTLPFHRNLENIFRSANNFNFPQFNDLIIVIAFLIGCGAVYFLLKTFLEKKQYNFYKFQKKYLLIIFLVYSVLNFNSLIRKNDFWIEKRNEVLNMNLEGKNSIIFIGEKTYTNQINLQILKYFTGLDGEILPQGQIINGKFDEIITIIDR
jgi:4-amino-4-deoxy-L-arabinose transferase-like glycosyltransferase